MSLEQDLFQDFLSDEDKSLKGAGGNLKFGLNSGIITKFEFNPNSGKDASELNALEIAIKIGDREVRQKIFETLKVFGKNGEITDTESDEYKKAYTTDVAQKRGLITHYLKVFYTEEELKVGMRTANVNSFVTLFKFAQKAIEAGIKSKGAEVDVFLQYQWNKSEGNAMTYLELPKNMKDGAFICKPIKPDGGIWKEVRDAKGLHYEDGKGNIHRFTREKSYLETPKAIQQKDNDSSTTVEDMGGKGTASTAW